VAHETVRSILHQDILYPYILQSASSTPISLSGNMALYSRLLPPSVLSRETFYVCASVRVCVCVCQAGYRTYRFNYNLYEAFIFSSNTSIITMKSTFKATCFDPIGPSLGLTIRTGSFASSNITSYHLRKHFFSVVLRPNAGHGLLILDVSRSHTTTHHSR